MTNKQALDWERIEAEYRAGLLSLREIAAKHPGSNHVAIARRAKKEGWSQDLSARIKAKAEELVTAKAVTAGETARKAVTAKQVVEENAQVIANIRLAHRFDIAKARKLCMNLLAELEVQTEHQDLYEQLCDALSDAYGDSEKTSQRRLELFNKATALGGRSSIMKSLADSLKTLVTLEREAYGFAPKVEITGKDGGPISHQNVSTDLSNLSDDELTALETIAAKLGQHPGPGDDTR